MNSILKKIFWLLPISTEIKEKISQKRFEYILQKERKYDLQGKIDLDDDVENCREYAEYILKLYKNKAPEYKEFELHAHSNKENITLIAYYLTQYHPNTQNDLWWGKGTTEWNNVNQAIPQYVGHYQPRKPGELGYYDLRIKEVFNRQILLAKNYGIGAFCFYYYWFDGKRLLEEPLNLFLKNDDLNIPFFYCWANENWTKRYSGTNDEVLMSITETEENYKEFIFSILDDFADKRYFKIQDKLVLSIYRPSLIPNVVDMLCYWRRIVRERIGEELFLIAVQENVTTTNWIDLGFDAETEFQPKQIKQHCKCINKNIKFIRKDFNGQVYDYEDFVNNKRYSYQFNQNKKVFPAIMPMWDNTARRNFRGTIFQGSTPNLYKTWLKDILNNIDKINDDDKIVFINAWNEWGEGAYLEPDEYYGYAYLQATWEASSEVMK